MVDKCEEFLNSLVSGIQVLRQPTKMDLLVKKNLRQFALKNNAFIHLGMVIRILK